MKIFFISITTLACIFSIIALHADFSEKISNEGLYIGLSAGAQFDHGCSNFPQIDPGYYVGGALGYKFCNFIRLEGECSFQRFNLKYRVIEEGLLGFWYRQVVSHRGNGNIIVGMANAYYDFDWINYPIKAYVGLGIGYAHERVKGEYLSSHQNALAWQAIAGISYPVCKNIDLSLEYRCFQENCLRSNKIGLSLRHFF